MYGSNCTISRPTFTEREPILCYHGPLLYEAKVLRDIQMVIMLINCRFSRLKLMNAHRDVATSFITKVGKISKIEEYYTIHRV